MDIITFWAFLFLLGLSLAVPLGPVNVEIIKQATFEKSHRKGFFLAIFTGIGASTGDFIIAFTVLTIGAALLTSIINDYAIKTILFAFNVLLLGFLGITTIRKPVMDTEEIINEEHTENNSNEFLMRVSKRYVTGLAIVVSSPWSYLWWASFGSYIIFGSAFNSFDVLSRLIIILCFLTGIWFWVFSFSSLLTLSKKFANDKFLTIIKNISALILLVYAVTFAFDTLAYLRLWLFSG